jgi:ABC-type nitrate/sulfonate/bicarbonate transport system substrate-binding protein
LDVEILEPAGGPANVARVASGATEFCLTSVSHFLKAQKRQRLPARFVAVVVQRSPMAGFVAADSALRGPSDLGHARLGGTADNELVAQFQAALVHRGIGPSPLTSVPYADGPAALARGAVDVIADYVDLLPRTRRQAGIALRAVPVGPDAYSSGLVAGDTVSSDLVATMRAALADALEHQRADPEWGVAALCHRYPEVDPIDAREGWALAEPNIFTGAPPGTMDAARWAFTVEHLSSAYRMDAPPVEAVYRDEFLSSAPDPTGAAVGSTMA